MLISFHGQLIFNSKKHPVGAEMLVRGVDNSESDNPVIVYPADIFSMPEFQGSYYHALDMLVMGAVSSYSSRIKKVANRLNYIFINLSDSTLKELLAYGEKCLIFKMLSALSQEVNPVRVVVEIHEQSLIDVQGALRVTNLLKSTGVLVAQDDYDDYREEYASPIEWHFIKKNASQELVCESAFSEHKSQKVIERATLQDMERCPNSLYQGFELHMPEDIGVLLKKLMDGKANF